MYGFPEEKKKKRNEIHLQTPTIATANRWTSFDKLKKSTTACEQQWRKKHIIEDSKRETREEVERKNSHENSLHRLLTGWKSFLQIRFEPLLFLKSQISTRFFSLFSFSLLQYSYLLCMAVTTTVTAAEIDTQHTHTFYIHLSWAQVILVVGLSYLFSVSSWKFFASSFFCSSFRFFQLNEAYHR